jgi:hypothetical protein
MYLKRLRKNAEKSLKVSINISTNTLGYWHVEPKHADLIDSVKRLAGEGLTNLQVAEQLNALGVKSHTGRDFYPQLIGALLSKYRRKEAARSVKMEYSVVVKNN